MTAFLILRELVDYIRRSDLDDIDFGRGLKASGLVEKATEVVRRHDDLTAAMVLGDVRGETR